MSKSCQKAALVLQYLPQHIYQLWQAIKWNGSGFFTFLLFWTRSLSFWLLPSQGHLTIFPFHFTKKCEKVRNRYIYFPMPLYVLESLWQDHEFWISETTNLRNLYFLLFYKIKDFDWDKCRYKQLFTKKKSLCSPLKKNRRFVKTCDELVM